MSDDVLVRVENVSKRFCRSLKRSLWYGLQDLGSEIGGRRHGGGSGLPQSSADVQLRPDEFWAVKDVSFELRRGECLGLIGRNGAGKTTLLRMLNGLIKPDTGRICMTGKVAALIALGAGFNPLLSGRENIYIASSVIGFSTSETKRLLDEIVSFSELDDFIDMPVQSYSSGMQVRLGFAVSSMLRPDVLILDEVLAVGDTRFRAKANKKISELITRASVIFVSHDMTHVYRICDSVMVLNCGASLFRGPVGSAVQVYDEINTLAQPSGSVNDSIVNHNHELVISSYWLSRDSSNLACINIQLDALGHIEIDHYIVNLTNEGGLLVAEDRKDVNITITPGPRQLQLQLYSLEHLNKGSYKIDVGFYGGNKKDILLHIVNAGMLEVNQHSLSPALTLCKSSLTLHT